MREMQTEHVNLVAIIDSAQLDAGHDSNAEQLAGVLCFRDAVDGVVVRERDRYETGALRGGDDISGSDGAIGRSRMHVEIHVALRRSVGIATVIDHAR
jgi:hypothetical protein